MLDISTHALTEGDISRIPGSKLHIISTHALTEGDSFLFPSLFLFQYFNSRPHGGRLISM